MNRLLACTVAVGLMAIEPALADELADDLAKVRSAATELGASDDAQQAWRRLAALDAEALPTLLTGMDDAGPLGENWLRAAVDAVAERELGSGASLPTPALETFVLDTSHSPRARRTAFEWLTAVDPLAKRRLIYKFLDDPSMSLRYDAVAQMIAENDALTEADAAEVKKNVYQKALGHARDPKQIESIAEKLKELGEEVDVPAVMGFLDEWMVIGPFDNTGLAHFDTEYAPEAQLVEKRIVPGGKNGAVSWKTAKAGADEGFVDFIEPLGKEKEAVAYAYTTFIADAGQSQVRYQSKNATKVWLNGELIAANEVYHSGGGFDQYVADVTLRQGENTLLVKACQNEQRMPWERDWSFRLRVVDALGTPVATQTAEEFEPRSDLPN